MLMPTGVWMSSKPKAIPPATTATVVPPRNAAVCHDAQANASPAKETQISGRLAPTAMRTAPA